MEPLRVTAGDTWTWVRALSEYPASAGWVLTYYLSLAAAAPKVIECTAQVDDHLAEVDAESSAEWTAGNYHWTARVKNTAGEVHSVATGTLVVDPDPTTTVDRRSWEERVLEVLEPAILASAGSLLVEYELDGVKAKMNRAEALALLDRCRRAVKVQRGGSPFRTIQIGLGRV